MKFFNILAFVITASATNAQTPLIAHKSHSGSSDSYFVFASSNFGDNPHLRKKSPQELYILSDNETFIPLNDSTIVLEVRNFERQVIKTDTLQNKQRHSPVLFQVLYEDSIRKKKLEENYKLEQEQEQEEQIRKQQLESQEQLNTPVPEKKKKKSYLLFLFGITGGGMLLIKLLGRSKPSIASV